MPPNNSRSLPQKAVIKFREIYEEEFHEAISDDEVHEMGFRLLDFLKLLLETDKKEKTLLSATKEEHAALKYLHHAIYHNREAPTVRDLSTALGFRSSRSGFLVLKKLIDRGFVYRGGDKKLQLAEHIRGCEVQFDTES